MRHLASVGKTMGTLCMSRVIDIRRCKSDDHTRWGRRSESDAGAATDHDDSLSEESPFGLDGRGAGCDAHDYSVQQPRIANSPH